MNDDNLTAGDWFFGKLLKMGANWKTTVRGIATAISFTLTMVASLSYGLDSRLTNILPPKVKGFLATAGIFATAALHIWSAIAQKSANVTGGSLQQTSQGDIAKQQPDDKPK